MEVSNINSWLTEDLLYLIFSLLPTQDLRAVVLVCTRWLEVGEAPGLWACLRLPLVTQRNMSTVPEILGFRRLQAARSLSLRRPGMVTEDLMEAVALHRGLEVLDVDMAELASLGPGLLARTLTGLQQVWLWNTDLTCQQAETILTAIQDPDSQLRVLHMGGNSELSSVDPGLLAGAARRLEDLMVWGKQLTIQQAEAILTAVCGGTKMRQLSIRYTSLSLLEPELLARSLISVISVDLRNTQLTSQQIQAILKAITSSSKLKKLNIGGNNMSGVDPWLLANAVNRLENVTLGHRRGWHFSSLTREQAEAILNQSLVKTHLKRMDVGAVTGGVDQTLVTKARQVIKHLDLEFDEIYQLD